MPKAVMTEEESPEEMNPDENVQEEEKVEEVPLDEGEEGGGVPLEDLDPEEELWDGGPTVAQALEWKQQFGKLFITSLDYDEHILWRPILRSEYKKHVRHIEKLTSNGQVSQLDANLLNEEMLAQTCMLWPRFDPTEESLAGVPSIISQEIMEASGFMALQVRQL